MYYDKPRIDLVRETNIEIIKERMPAEYDKIKVWSVVGEHTVLLLLCDIWDMLNELLERSNKTDNGDNKRNSRDNERV